MGISLFSNFHVCFLKSHQKFKMDSQRIELETLNSLVAAVEKMMDHSTSQKERMQAYEVRFSIKGGIIAHQ